MLPNTVLSYLFPKYSSEIVLLRDNSISAIASKDISIKDLETGKMTGINVGEKVIDYAKNDNSNAVWDNKIPIGDNCVWSGNNRSPYGTVLENIYY